MKISMKQMLMLLAGLLLGLVTITVITHPALAQAPADPTADFVITVKTDNPGTSGSTQFTIPTFTGETYNYNVDCNNDGVNEVTGATGNYTCDYGADGLNTGAGTYTVRIKDNTSQGTGFPRIYFNGGGEQWKLLTLEQWGKGKWTSMNNSFYMCYRLTGKASAHLDLRSLDVHKRIVKELKWVQMHIASGRMLSWMW